MGNALSILLFAASLSLYTYTATQRHAENPGDRVVPTITQVMQELHDISFEKDRKGQYMLWTDLKASGFRFSCAVALLGIAVLLGLNMGALPYVERLFLLFLLFIHKIPPLALTPILFIAFGVDELSKVMLMAVGTFPSVALDTYLRAKKVPDEQKVIGFSLGASDFEVTYTIILPQIWPDILNTVRLNLNALVIYLIAGESLAATSGMGYRIFVVRRHMAMDTIIVYVLVMTVIVLAMDYFLKWRILRRTELLGEK